MGLAKGLVQVDRSVDRGGRGSTHIQYVYGPVNPHLNGLTRPKCCDPRILDKGL